VKQILLILIVFSTLSGYGYSGQKEKLTKDSFHSLRHLYYIDSTYYLITYQGSSNCNLLSLDKKLNILDRIEIGNGLKIISVDDTLINIAVDTGLRKNNEDIKFLNKLIKFVPEDTIIPCFSGFIIDSIIIDNLIANYTSKIENLTSEKQNYLYTRTYKKIFDLLFYNFPNDTIDIKYAIKHFIKDDTSPTTFNFNDLIFENNEGYYYIFEYGKSGHPINLGIKFHFKDFIQFRDFIDLIYEKMVKEGQG
jgi:hypothetical protein